MIAVTGGNGLLGSYVIRKLVAEGRPFIALKRKGSDISLLNDLQNKITWKDADVQDPVALEEAFQNVMHVVHAAAIVSFNPRRASEVMDINVIGTRNVVNACLNNNVRRLVHISSVAALGRQKGQRVIDESNKWNTSSLNSVYGESKYLAELEIIRGQEEGLSTALINPSVILAPADWNRSSAQLFKYVWNEKAFYIDAFLNYVDVRDVAEVVCRMLDAPYEGERFIVSAGNIPFIEFFKKIAGIMNKKAPTISPPIGLLNVVARLETFRTWFTGTEPLVTRETVKLAGTEFIYENQKVRKELDFEFQPIDKTLLWCCQYYIDKMNGKN